MAAGPCHLSWQWQPEGLASSPFRFLGYARNDMEECVHVIRSEQSRPTPSYGIAPGTLLHFRQYDATPTTLPDGSRLEPRLERIADANTTVHGQPIPNHSRAARRVGHKVRLQQLRVAGGALLRRAALPRRHSRHSGAPRGQRGGHGGRLHAGGPGSHGDGGASGRGTSPVHGPAHQRVAGQSARGGDHLRGRHRQLRRQHHPGPRPQLRSDVDIGAVHQGQLDCHRAGGPAAGHRARHTRREDAPRRAGAPGRIRPAAEHTTGGHTDYRRRRAGRTGGLPLRR